MIIDRLHYILQRFRAPQGEGGDGGGGSEDRGDDFTPTDDDTVVGGDDTTKGGDDTTTGGDDTTAGGDDTVTGGDDDDPDAVKDPKGEKKGGKDARKDTRIPVSRHKEILQKERERADALEKQLAQYQGGDRIAVINEDIKQSETKVLALDKEYTKLVTDGEHEKAAAKMQEIRALEREIADKKGDLKAQAASSRAVEKMRYDITVERLEAAYPALNPEHDDFDEDQAQDVMDLATTYRTQRGMTPAEAIQRAAKKLLGAETKKQTDATEVTARVNPKDAEARAAAEQKEAERKKNQVQKNIDAGKKQPPDANKLGADSDRAGGGGGLTGKDVMKMSQADFNKLDQETLSRLRGDVYAGS